mmetsp:Transcript_27846/g.67753  ORF Transcript_27846/g.67753 Transcript_27846/m.67753 type:complete len:326 (+) Transcript_27846:84-1061(+)
MIVTTMAISESPSNRAVECGGSTSSAASDNLKEDYAAAAAAVSKADQQDALKPNIIRSSYSDIDRLLDASERADESGYSETDGLDYDTMEPVPSAEFIVDLSKLTPEEVESLLKHTKETGAKRAAENAKAIREMEQKLANLQNKLKRKLNMTSTTNYTQAIKTDMPLPTYVTASQTQLCRAFHVNEVYMNQTKKMQKRNKKLLVFLKKQIKLLTEESQRREVPLQDEITESRTEVVRMCRILEIDPDDWKRRGSNELMEKITEIFSGVPVLGEWARSFSEGSSTTRSINQSHSQGSNLGEWTKSFSTEGGGSNRSLNHSNSQGSN